VQTNERANGVAEAAQRLAKANFDAQRTVWERLVEAQESQAEFAQSMFESTLGSFRTQAEQNLDVWQEVLEQARKGQGAAQVLGKESMHAYADFLDSLFFYYGESARAAERSTRQG
jgi:hypothetical protein